MIAEDYVSFETAKLLKEKGFKMWCYKSYGTAVYHKGVPISFDEECDLKDEGLEDEIEYVEGGYLYDFGCDNRKEDAKVYAAPTLQRAMKWLREVHHLHLSIDSYPHEDNCFYWCYKVLFMDESNLCSIKKHAKASFDSFEAAVEAAIKYCLENLS
jgi:hypothetical protein